MNQMSVGLCCPTKVRVWIQEIFSWNSYSTTIYFIDWCIFKKKSWKKKGLERKKGGWLRVIAKANFILSWSFVLKSENNTCTFVVSKDVEIKRKHFIMKVIQNNRRWFIKCGKRSVWIVACWMRIRSRHTCLKHDQCTEIDLFFLFFIFLFRHDKTDIHENYCSYFILFSFFI